MKELQGISQLLYLPQTNQTQHTIGSGCKTLNKDKDVFWQLLTPIMFIGYYSPFEM